MIESTLLTLVDRDLLEQAADRYMVLLSLFEMHMEQRADLTLTLREDLQELSKQAKIIHGIRRGEVIREWPNMCPSCALPTSRRTTAPPTSNSISSKNGHALRKA